MSQDLIARLEAIEAEAASLRAELAKAQKPTPWERWKPEHGGCYYFVKSNGVVTQYPWDGGNQDTGYYNFGNCFPTHEAAERHAKRLRSMVPTCPVPKKGEPVWWVSLAQETPASKSGTYIGTEPDVTLYNLGRIFASEQAANAWIAEFADAWTTLEDAS